MLSKVHSYGLSGLEATLVTIEVDVARGLPSTIIVGLPDNAVKESRERVRSAIKNSHYKFAPQRITINLAPADIKKEGPSFDLAMALGVLAATHLEGGKPVSFQDLANLYFGISGIDPSKASAKLFDQLGENAPGKYRQMVNDVKFKFQVF